MRLHLASAIHAPPQSPVPSTHPVHHIRSLCESHPLVHDAAPSRYLSKQSSPYLFKHSRYLFKHSPAQTHLTGSITGTHQTGTHQTGTHQAGTHQTGTHVEDTHLSSAGIGLGTKSVIQLSKDESLFVAYSLGAYSQIISQPVYAGDNYSLQKGHLVGFGVWGTLLRQS